MLSYTEEKLRIKRTVPVEYQGEHIRGKTEGEMTAFMEGYAACLEDAMHEARCYAGFHWYGPVDANGGRHAVNDTSPDYLPWRKLYYTNGIAKG